MLPIYCEVQFLHYNEDDKRTESEIPDMHRTKHWLDN
jgi:hypothetical protein